MTIRRLKEMYPTSNVSYCIHSKGGSSADWSAIEAKTIFDESKHAAVGSDTDETFKDDSAYKHVKPDILVLGFGANDAMNGDSSYKFKSQIETAVTGIQEINSSCDIILVASMICNPDCFPIERFTEFAKRLYEVEAAYDNVTVADLTSVHKYLLTFKDYLDMSGDNMCHPNDFMARLLAGIVIKTLTPTTLDEYKASMASMLKFYTEADLYRDGEKTALMSIITEGTAKINECADFESVSPILAEYKEKIDVLPTDKDLVVGEMDYSNIVFDSASKVKIMTGTDCAVSYSEAEKAAALTISPSPLFPFGTIDFSSSTKTITASDYTHLVIVYKNPTTNSKAATDPSVEFFVNDSTPANPMDYTTYFDFEKADEYSYITVDLTEEDFWEGDVSGLRLYPCFRGTPGDTFYIDSIMLVNGANEAEKAAQARIYNRNNPTADNIVYVFGTLELAKAALSVPDIDYMMGDANQDLRINAVDALVLRKYLTSNVVNISIPSADSNMDGRINAADALTIRKIIVGDYESSMQRDFLADIGYNTTAKATEIVSNGFLGYTNLTYFVNNEKVNTDAYKYAVITYRADQKVDLKLTADGYDLTTESLISDGIFHSIIVDLSSLPSGMSLNEFVLSYGSMSLNNALYLNSFAFCANETEAQKTVLIRDAAANA